MMPRVGLPGRCLAFAPLLFAAVAGAQEFPTKAKPWTDVTPEKRAAYRAEIQALMALPVGQVKPHPAAADFPGAPPADAPLVTRELTVDTAITGWHSTGAYAAPGAVITVTVPESVAGAKLAVRIGAHRDRLWSDTIKKWTRVPEITRSFPVTATATKAGNAFGGPVYVEVPAGLKAGKVAVKIEGAVAAPHFVLGRTTVEQWREARLAPAPWAELESPAMIVTVPSELVRKIDDPTKVMELWDRIAKAEDWLGAVEDRTRPERAVFDRQISAGYMHSGYPFMAGLGEAANAVEFDRLTRGNWGFFHELGHNHQKSEWTPAGTVEVTCNIFTMFVMESVCGRPKTSHGDMSEAARLKRMKAFFGGARSHDDWKKDPFLALILYWQLSEGFGWEPFRKVFGEYPGLAPAARPKTDADKHGQFMVRFSKAVGRNLGPFFRAWAIPVTQAHLDEVAGLPEWMPEKDFPKAYESGK